MKFYKKILLLLLFFFGILIFNCSIVSAFTFTSQYDNKEYTVPDVETVGSNYLDYLSNGYVIQKWGPTNYALIILKSPDNFFYTTDKGVNIFSSSYSYRFNIDISIHDSWSDSSSSNSKGAWGGVIYYAADIFADTNKTNYYYKMPTEPPYVFPYIADTDEVLCNLDNIDDILILPGSLSKDFLPLKLSIYKYVDDITVKGVLELSLDTSSPYYLYIIENPDDYWWEIPTELFKNSLENGQEYHFVLLGSNEYDDFSITRSVIYQGTTYVPPTDEEIQTEAINNQTQKIEEQTNVIINQTDKIEEQTEVNKGIFARIGDILSYINPLSENFFAYKLIDLLIDALKSLFVPEERFFRFLF